MNRSILSHVFFCLLGLQSLHAQFSFNYNDSIPVIRFGDTLNQPWAGGLNYVQVSDFDYNQDGQMDLFCFDRSSNNIRVYETILGSNGPTYQYVHNAKNDFPSDLRYRVQLVDFDQDGRKDIFTWGLGGGLKVYRNVSDPINGIQWSLFQSVVQTDYAVNGVNPLDITADDLPAIVDVDNDGDIDILTSDAQGLRIEYHQNQSIQMYGTPDSLLFVQKNECWGQFSEGITNFTINLNDSTPPCVNGNIPNPERGKSENEKKMLHQGTSILCLDIDSSGVKDLIMGDAAFSGLTLLTNGGTAVNTNSPMISYDETFPSYSTPVKCQNFPGAFYVDVNFDGLRDLLASPNTEINALDRESLIYYQNIGSDAVPVFMPITSNFLQNEMIEHGTGSIPVLFDYNGDSLMDLLVANYYNYKPVGDKESIVALYLNVGTSTEPAFEFVDNDIFNLSSENLGLRTVPTFGDIDSDGDEDLLLGLENGSIAYYENITIGATPLWSNPIFNFTDSQGSPINVNAFAHPQLFDLDGDSLIDLLVGNRFGSIHYYRNVGTASSPAFELVNATLGEVDILPGNQSSNAAIHFFRENNEIHLFCGAFNGSIAYYDDIDGNYNPGDTFHLVSDNYQNINVGKHSAIYTYDLDQNGTPNLFLGQDLGGLFHYDLNIDSTLSINEYTLSSIALYPNPSSGNFTVSAAKNIEVITIIDMHGKHVHKQPANSKELTLFVQNVPLGMYFVTIELETGELITKKMILR